ncbi:WD repeat and HMG-box DNA-binding protein 1-like isoform X2 [Tripterygium wilfordii]|uniref:WD repeat and HMG-box DNA-binding protein 1-like isoform X2 n=1 Tax=Tripterygium wilfordii TaxID=458696 RepID=UPI0018F81FC2|nr:WD repeat and HMG-box DNA-binding protein 1-like isoform X2 [Tripterygium wilfordii]
MKVRTVKLREVHKASGSGGHPSFCSILWDHQAHHLVTASSADPTISVHDPLLPSCAPKIIRDHRDGVTALALSPNSTCLASGSVDHSVKLYKFPSGQLETNITRFTLPIRVLAFNKSGSMLAVAGDDEGIKLINTIDGSIARVLKGHRETVTGLAFDPNSEYLASIDSRGTVIYWELQSGIMLHTLQCKAPNTSSNLSTMNVLSWSPDGEILAVPGVDNNVVMYDRDTAEKLFELKGEHIKPVCFLSWSPNGKYMATSSLDRQVLIWDVDKKQDIDRQKFDDILCCMAWKPIGNALAVIDVTGKYGVWESVVPSSMKSPTENIPNSQSKKSSGFLLFDEEEQEPSVSGNLSDLGESEPSSRKRSRKPSVFEEDNDEDVDNGWSLLPKTESLRKSRVSKESLDNGPGRLRSDMQESFQPGATPVQPGKRRFLCYNMLGSITTVEQDGYSHIEIDFHDTGRGPRVPSMTDYFGFTMASLNESGSVFANPCKGENSMSTLMYKPFSSWANNSEWSMRFEGEEVKAVALGTAWVAAVTSLNFLRIYTDGGLQRDILCLDGPVVTASGFKDELAVVTHLSDCASSSDQMLEFRVLNISRGTQPFKGRLPLTPGSCLSWFGFSEEGQLSSYDSKGVLMVFTSQYGGTWLPVFSGSRDKSDENYWMVGLNAQKLFCIVCKKPDLFPQVVPKPVLSLLDLSVPLASSDLGKETLENEFVLNNMRLSQIQGKIKEMEVEGMDTTTLVDEAFDMEVAQDRCILKLIGCCCTGDKLERAAELAKLLSLDSHLEGAIKLATRLKLPKLAEEFNNILEERLLNKSKGPLPTPLPNPNGNVNTAADVAVSKTTSSERSKKAEPPTPSVSPKLSAPLFVRKGIKPVKENGCQNRSADGEGSKDVNEIEKVAGDMSGVEEVKKVSNPFLKSSSSEEKAKKSVEINQVKAQRPSNPFLKSSVK